MSTLMQERRRHKYTDLTIIVNGKEYQYKIATFHSDATITSKLDEALYTLQGVERVQNKYATNQMN